MHSELWQSGMMVLSLAVLEALLSIDNAVVLALIARRLKLEEQKKALSYGLIGAVVLRLLAVAMARWVIQYPWLRIMGGLYLLWISIRHFSGKKGGGTQGPVAPARFWKVVFWIEFTDLIFAVDSILAAVALTTDYFVIVVGGILGVILVRFAAGKMILLLNRHPWIETFAYLLVAGVGIKVLYPYAHSF